MEVGLLWYDSDPGRSLADKIGRAARRYCEKFGRPPNRCYVHPSVFVDSGPAPLACRLEDSEPAVLVVSAPNVLLHHYWLGVSSNPAPARTGTPA